MTTLLCIVAHPDDETMLCGGILAGLAARGVQIQVLCATRGEGGEMGEPPLTTRELLGRMREQEMRCACEKLGVHSVQFLDYIDPTVGPDEDLYPFTEDEETLYHELLASMHRQRPDIILSHGRDGEYGHPAHRLLFRIAWRAFQNWLAGKKVLPRDVADRPEPYFYTIAAAVPGHEDRIYNDSEPADLVLHLEGTPWLEAKATAALCHATQHALFKRRKKAQTVREVLRRVESLHRYWPTEGPDAPVLVRDDFMTPAAEGFIEPHAPE